MSKKIGGVVALVAICALSLFLLNCGSSSSRPTGVLYVLTQVVNGLGNTVSSFAINLENGAIELVNSNATTCPTSPTQANPIPCGAPLDILLDPLGATAFVLNQGVPCVQQGNQCVASGSSPAIAPSIIPYSVNSDGSLSAPGSPVYWTPCASPPCTASTSYPDTAKAMVRDATGQFLFVIDQGSYPPPGYPTPTQTSPSCPHAPSGPTDMCPSISVFMATPGSTTLTLASGSPFFLSKIPTGLSAIAFTPPGGATGEELLFVSNNEDICSQACIPPSPNNDNTVSVYAVNSSGLLTEQPNSPYTIQAANPISVTAVNTNAEGSFSGGVFVYVGNQASGPGAVNPFQLCTVENSNCSQADVAANLMVAVTCAPAQSCAASGPGYPAVMLVDPTNNFLYVMGEVSNNVYGYRINTDTGTLAPLAPANQPAGTQPVSMALHPTIDNTGQYLFVSNSNSDNISSFSLDTTTGAMGVLPITIAPAPPSGMAAH
jgi:hypothetical protein